MRKLLYMLAGLAAVDAGGVDHQLSRAKASAHVSGACQAHAGAVEGVIARPFARRRAEDDREDEVGGQANALDESPRHDRRGRPGEEEEGQEEDEAQMARQARLQVPAHAGAPRCGKTAEARELGRTGVPFGRAAVLEAAVDVPAEVVEARRDDGDGEDVLHRRRHDVLAARNAGLVRHEADVDQPHDHDGEEVEDLEQDQAVEGDLLLELLGRRRLSEKRGQHGRKRRGHKALLGTHARALRHTNPRTTVRNESDAAQVRPLHLFRIMSVRKPHSRVG